MIAYELPKPTDRVPDGYDPLCNVLYPVECPAFIGYLSTNGETLTGVSERLACIFKVGDSWYDAVQRIKVQGWPFKAEEE